MPLRLRLTLFYSAFFALILVAVAFSVYTLTERSLTATLEQRAFAALEELQGGELDESIARLPGDVEFEVFIMGSDFNEDQFRSAVQLRPRFFQTSALRGQLQPADIATLAGGGRIARDIRDASGRPLFVTGQAGSVILGERPFNVVALVGVPAGAVTAALGQLARNLVLTVVLAFLAFALGVFLLSRQVLAPVKRVTQAAALVSGRDLSQRVPAPRSKDEMNELAVTLNSMLDRLQESFETQRRFTADASHELRTPVTAIVGHTNYLLRRTRPSAEQIDSLTVIRREAERMAKLVNDLLELARADAGLTIRKEPMNLVEVVEAVHQEVAPVATGAEVTAHIPEPLVEVLGDPSRLKQVLLNLVTNALNAGAERVSITLLKERHLVRLEVLDDGPGIPEEAVPHLFDRFYRVDNARSTRGNGSGLGLAIVKWIVQQHGGSVEVESRLGEGSAFTVTLPILNPKGTEASVRQTIQETIGMLKTQRDP